MSDDLATPGTGQDPEDGPPRAPREPGPDPTPPGVSEEDLEDAWVEGDRTVTPGTARAAWQHPLFRRIWLGALVSNMGTWMQNAALGAFAFALTESETFVSLVVLVQLGPLLLFTLVGGILADLIDRRRLLLIVAWEQLAFSTLLAWVVAQPDPSKVGILAVVLAIGIGQAIHAPTFSALLPVLVPRRDLTGAVSLQSANMNASRVVGPAIGGVIMGTVGVPWVFLFNAVTYLVIIAVVWTATFPPVPAPPGQETGLARVLAGFRVARRDRIVGRCLLVMVLFSFFCLNFVPQLAAVAGRNLGIDPVGSAYGLLYATFGLGALLGALSIGTVLSGSPLPTVVRLGLAGFAVTVSAFALLRTPAPAYPVVLLLGFCYFATVTSLSTVLQLRLEDHERGRVMALWIMAFGGTVPIGTFVFGPIMEAVGITPVLLFSAAFAVVLIPLADLAQRPDDAPAPSTT